MLLHSEMEDSQPIGVELSADNNSRRAGVPSAQAPGALNSFDERMIAFTSSLERGARRPHPHSDRPKIATFAIWFFAGKASPCFHSPTVKCTHPARLAG